MSRERGVRYTAAQMDAMAKTLHYSGTDEFSDEAASMLAQAAVDVAGVVEALRDMVTVAMPLDGLDQLALANAQNVLARFQP